MTARATASTPTQVGNPKDTAGARLKPVPPHVIVLFGAAGDLSRRKLIPGLLRLFHAGLLPECRIVGTSLEALDHDGFRAFARAACDEFSRSALTEEEWSAFAAILRYVPQAAGPSGLAAEVEAAGARARRRRAAAPLPERPAARRARRRRACSARPVSPSAPAS